MGEHLISQVQPERRFAKSAPVLFAAIASVFDPKMAARFEKLERTRDRLGRVFSKRTKEPGSKGGSKQALHRRHSPSPPPPPTSTSPQSTPDPQIFPSPSFLRPTASRMQARDEVKVTARSARRAQSLPENSTSHGRMPSIDESLSSSVTSFFAVSFYPKVPKRSSSLLHRRRDPSIAGLLEFSFSDVRSDSRNSSVSSSATEPTSPRRKAARSQSPRLSRLQGPLPIFSARRPDTPPCSDTNSNYASPSLAPSLLNKPLPPPPPGAGMLTPEPSPEIQPLSLARSNPIPTNPLLSAGTKMQKHRSLEAPEAPVTGAVSLRKTVSDSKLSKTVASINMDDFILEEPTVETFLSLSDDDIADGPPVTPLMTPPSGRFAPSRLGSGRAPTFDLPPDPPVFQLPSPRSGSKRYSPLICLSSPLTSRPAKVAAFECTRIAKRFKFDLIYIVNLWPENLGHTPTTSSTSSIPAPDYSLGSPRRAAVRSRTPTLEPSSLHHPSRRPQSLTGRLLAGHGLANLQTPFMISSAAHAKILHQDGWVEWRDEVPSPDHFSRGYSRAFYAGVSGPEPSSTSSAAQAAKPPAANASVVTLSEKRRSQQQKNRGIVFAAYRFPDPDGTTRKTDKGQLEALYAEAETLVEMLLDIHKTERSRRAITTRLQQQQQRHLRQPDVEVGVGGRVVEVGDSETGPLPVRQPFFA